MKVLSNILDPNSINNSRLDWIDYAKGITITLVVYRHVLIGLGRAGLAIDPDLFITTHIGLTFRMPLFFLLSGIFFQKSIEKRTRSGYFFHKLKTIMYPYFIWSFIQMSMQMMLIDYTNAQFASITDYLLILFKPIAQFWFLYALFNVSALYLVLSHWIKSRWVLLILGVILFYFAPDVKLGKLIFDIMRLFVFFVVGDIISKYLLDQNNYKKLASPVLALVLFGMAVLGEWIIVGQKNEQVLLLLIFALIGSSSTINISFILASLRSRILTIVRIVGYHSLYIFMLHAIISAAFRIVMINLFGLTHVPFLLVGGTLLGVIGPVVFHSMSLRLGLWFLFTPYNPTRKKMTSTKV